MQNKKWLNISLMVTLLSCFCGATVAFSQTRAEARLNLEMTAQKEVKVQKNGKWTMELLPLEKAAPGDVLLYTITYANRENSPALEAAIVNPLPPGTVYVLDSAVGADAEVTCSIDGGRSYHKPPLMIRVKLPDGKEVDKPALAESYTHVRFALKKPVAPGQSGRVSMRVKVK